MASQEKFHISNGLILPCKAKRKCPVNPLDYEHFDNYVLAQQYIENKNKDFTIPKQITKPTLQETKPEELREVKNLEKVARMHFHDFVSGIIIKKTSSEIEQTLKETGKKPEKIEIRMRDRYEGERFNANIEITNLVFPGNPPFSKYLLSNEIFSQTFRGKRDLLTEAANLESLSTLKHWEENEEDLYQFLNNYRDELGLESEEFELFSSRYIDRMRSIMKMEVNFQRAPVEASALGYSYFENSFQDKDYLSLDDDFNLTGWQPRHLKEILMETNFYSEEKVAVEINLRHREPNKSGWTLKRNPTTGEWAVDFINPAKGKRTFPIKDLNLLKYEFHKHEDSGAVLAYKGKADFFADECKRIITETDEIVKFHSDSIDYKEYSKQKEERLKKHSADISNNNDKGFIKKLFGRK